MRTCIASGNVAIGLTVALSVAVFAEERTGGLGWMSGTEIRSEFAGRGIAGIYPSNAPWTEMIFEDGSTDYRESEKHWKGRWWLRGREFCFQYPPPGVGGCFRVTRLSANCFELYDFSNPIGQEDVPPEEADRWNGRLWRQDRPQTCPERPTV